MNQEQAVASQSPPATTAKTAKKRKVTHPHPDDSTGVTAGSAKSSQLPNLFDLKNPFIPPAMKDQLMESLAVLSSFNSGSTEGAATSDDSSNVRQSDRLGKKKKKL